MTCPDIPGEGFLKFGIYLPAESHPIDSTMKPAVLFTLLFALCFSACNKDNENKTSKNNYFELDGTVYQVDSIEHTFNTSLRPLKIHSKDNGGAAIYIHTMPDKFPAVDGVYQFQVKATRHDSLDVDVCFETDDRASEYCAVEGVSGQSLSTLTVTVSGGKWSVSLPATTVYDNSAKTLKIDVSE
jgi:hypothetical protein